MSGGREAILKAAMRTFAEKGFAGASTREICASAGVTKPVLYYHFRNKQHLYEELMIDSFGQYRKTLLKASTTRGTLRERLIRMVYADFRAGRDDPFTLRFVLRMIFSPGEQHTYFDYVREMESQRKIIAGVIREGIESGEIRGDAHELATALMGIQLFTLLENLFTGKPALSHRRAEKCVDSLLESCLAS